MIARHDLTEHSPPAVPNAQAAMVRCLQESGLFREYREAFEASTGLPLVLRAAGAFQAPLEGSKRANSFCTLMIRSGKTCAACLQLQQRAEKDAALETKTLQCHAGLVESLVPVRVGDLVLAYLQTGQVFLRTPSKRRFNAIRASLPGETPEGLEATYFRTRVMPRNQYQAIIRLLVIFAGHLATISNQLLTSRTTTEAPMITKVRTFIALHQDEDLGLTDAARAVGMSPFYFCKVFKKSTGLTFTEYLARSRIETVKHMLLDVHMRVSEAAYASGFQSLSQFNRVFLRVAGEAPRDYRDRLHEANARP